MEDGEKRLDGRGDGPGEASLSRDSVAIAITKMVDSHVASSIARRFGTEAGLDRRRAGELAVVVSELATNIVKHGGGRGRIELSRSPSGVHVRSIDDGRRPEHGAYRGRPGLGCGGGAVRRLMDWVEESPRSEGGLEVCALKRA